MRILLIPFAALAVALPATAWADDGCPTKATPELLTALGEPTATLSGGQTVYQPSGTMMMGMLISYVVVTKSSSGAVQEIDYRFAGLMRKYGQRFPVNVLQAFDKTYSGASCASGKVTSCGTAFDSKASGDLLSAEINEAYIEVPAKAEGAGVAMVKADYSSQTQGPVFLVCQYN
jgi:hypothetical protein